MSKKERVRFAEYCSRLSNDALYVATAEQIVAAEQQGIIEPFQPEESHKRKKQSIRQIQRRRRIADKLSPWTEIVGVRLPKPDDPVLLQFKKADDESHPLRLVILCMMKVLYCGCWACNIGVAIGILGLLLGLWDRGSELYNIL